MVPGPGATDAQHPLRSAPAPLVLLLLLPPRPLHFYRLDSSTAPHGACAAPSLPSARRRAPALLPRSRARRPGFLPFLDRVRAGTRTQSSSRGPGAAGVRLASVGGGGGVPYVSSPPPPPPAHPGAVFFRLNRAHFYFTRNAMLSLGYWQPLEHGISSIARRTLDFSCKSFAWTKLGARTQSARFALLWLRKQHQAAAPLSFTNSGRPGALTEAQPPLRACTGKRLHIP